MASKGGKVKRFVLIAVLLVLVTVIFILAGGGRLLKSAGAWIGTIGKKAEHVKGRIEDGAVTVEKRVERVKDSLTGDGK